MVAGQIGGRSHFRLAVISCGGYRFFHGVPYKDILQLIRRCGVLPVGVESGFDAAHRYPCHKTAQRCRHTFVLTCAERESRAFAAVLHIPAHGQAVFGLGVG